MMHQPFTRTPPARTASAMRGKRSPSANKGIGTAAAATSLSSPLRPHAEAGRNDRHGMKSAEADKSAASARERRPQSVYRSHELSERTAAALPQTAEHLQGHPATRDIHHNKSDGSARNTPPLIAAGLPTEYTLSLASLAAAHPLSPSPPITAVLSSARREGPTRLSHGPTLLQDVCAAMSTMTVSVSRSSKSRMRSSLPRSLSPPLLTTSPSRPRNSRAEKEGHKAAGGDVQKDDEQDEDEDDDEVEAAMSCSTSKMVHTSMTAASGRAMAPVAHIRIRPLLSYLGETQEMRRVFFLDHENLVISAKPPAERAHTTGTRSDVSTSLSSTLTHGQNVAQVPTRTRRPTIPALSAKKGTQTGHKSAVREEVHETPLVSCSPSDVSLAAEQDEEGSSSKSVSNRLSEVSLNSSPADFTLRGTEQQEEEEEVGHAHMGLAGGAAPIAMQPRHDSRRHSASHNKANVAGLRVPSPPKQHHHQQHHHQYRCGDDRTSRYKSPRAPASSHSSPLQSTTTTTAQLGFSVNHSRDETSNAQGNEATGSGHGLNTSSSFAPGHTNAGKAHYFSFEFIHDEDATQEDVFEESVLRFADEALLAHNVAILCYGPTGSGKTYSMMGGGGGAARMNSTGTNTSGRAGALWAEVTDEPATEAVSRSASSSPRRTDSRRGDSRGEKRGEGREESWPAVVSSGSAGLYRPGNAASLLLDEDAAMRSLGGAHSGEMGLLPRLVLVLLDRRGVSVSLVREREEKSAEATAATTTATTTKTRNGAARKAATPTSSSIIMLRQGMPSTTPIPRRPITTSTNSNITNTRSPQRRAAGGQATRHPQSVSAGRVRSRSATKQTAGRAKTPTAVSATTRKSNEPPMQTPRTRNAARRGLRQLSLTLQGLTFYGVELYNDELADLLDPAKRPIPNVSDLGGLEALCAQLDHNPANTGSTMSGGTSVGQTPRTARPRNTSSTGNGGGGGGMVIDTLEDLRRAYGLARRNRVTSSHKLNDTSSRSHAVFILQLSFSLRESAVNGGTERPDPDTKGNNSNHTPEGNAAAYDEEHIRSYVVLVDLAGCERVKETQVAGTALREAQYINRSLSALSSVVLALYRRSSHIPYRDSKLTRLLRPCLQDGRVLTLVHVAPCSVTNTIHALQFADRVRHTLMPMHNRVDEGKRGLLALFEELVDPSQGQLEADLHESEQRHHVLCAEVRLAYLTRYQNEQQQQKQQRQENEEEKGEATSMGSPAMRSVEVAAAEGRGNKRNRSAGTSTAPAAGRGVHGGSGKGATNESAAMLAPVLHTLPAAQRERNKSTSNNSTGGSTNQKAKPRGVHQERRGAALRAMIDHYLAPLRANEEAETQAAIHRIEHERDRRIAACVRRCSTAEARLRGALDELTRCNAQLLQENASPLPSDPYTTELTKELQRTNEAMGDTTRETQAMSGLANALRQRLALQEELLAATEADLQAALRREFTSTTSSLAAAAAASAAALPITGDTNGMALPSTPPLITTTASTSTSNSNNNAMARAAPAAGSTHPSPDDTSFATTSWMLDTLATVTDPSAAPATTNTLLSSLPLLSAAAPEPLTGTVAATSSNNAVSGAEEQSWREVCEQQILLAREMAALRREVACLELGDAVWEGLWARAMRTQMYLALRHECAMMGRVLCNADALRAWLRLPSANLVHSPVGTQGTMLLCASEVAQLAEVPAEQHADWARVMPYLAQRTQASESEQRQEDINNSSSNNSVSKAPVTITPTTPTASPSAVSMSNNNNINTTTISGDDALHRNTPALSLAGVQDTNTASASSLTTTTSCNAMLYDCYGDEAAMQRAALTALASQPGTWCEACVVGESWGAIARRYGDLVSRQASVAQSASLASTTTTTTSSTTTSSSSSSARSSYSENHNDGTYRTMQDAGGNDDGAKDKAVRRQDTDIHRNITSRSLGQSLRARHVGRAARKYTDGWLIATASATERRCGHLRLRPSADNDSSTPAQAQPAGYVLELCCPSSVHEPEYNVSSSPAPEAQTSRAAATTAEPGCYFALPLNEPTLHFNVHLIESGAMDVARRSHRSSSHNTSGVRPAPMSYPFMAIEVIGVPAHVPRPPHRTTSHSPSSPMTMSGTTAGEKHGFYASSHIAGAASLGSNNHSNTTTVPVSRRGSLTLPSALWHTMDTNTVTTTHAAQHLPPPSSYASREGMVRCTILLRHGPPCMKPDIMSAVMQAETIVAALSALLLPSASAHGGNAGRAVQQQQHQAGTRPRHHTMTSTPKAGHGRGAPGGGAKAVAKDTTTTQQQQQQTAQTHNTSEYMVTMSYKHLPSALLPQAVTMEKMEGNTAVPNTTTATAGGGSSKAKAAAAMRQGTRGKALTGNATSRSVQGNAKTQATSNNAATLPLPLQAGTLQVYIHMSHFPPIEDWLATAAAASAANNHNTTHTLSEAVDRSVSTHTSVNMDAMLAAVQQLCRAVSALDSLRRARLPHYDDTASQQQEQQQEQTSTSALSVSERAVRFVSAWLHRLRAWRRRVRAAVRQDIYDAEDIKGEPMPSLMQGNTSHNTSLVTTSYLLDVMREANALLRLRFAPALMLEPHGTHTASTQGPHNEEGNKGSTIERAGPANLCGDARLELPLTLAEARVLGTVWHVPWSLWQWASRWPLLQKMMNTNTSANESSSSGAMSEGQSWAAQLTAWLLHAQQPQPQWTSTSFVTAFSQRSFSPLATHHRDAWGSEGSSSSESSHSDDGGGEEKNNTTLGVGNTTMTSNAQDVLRPVATTRLCLQPLPCYMACMAANGATS